MKIRIFVLIILLTICNTKLFPQVSPKAGYYSHKVTVAEVLQTKSYTYLRVMEKINDKDSLQWLALPFLEASMGDVFYFERGLQMGEFHSKELNRDFKNILFLGGLSTSPEISEKYIVPAQHAPFEDTTQKAAAPIQSHEVVVKEVLQTSGYTYLRVKENGKEEWLAVNKIPAVSGQTYTYSDAAIMTNFQSKELNRTFKEILFIGKLNLKSNVDNLNETSGQHPQSLSASVSSDPKISSATVAGGISIASLYENKKLYEGKKVIIKGKVTKYSPNILNKNWIHIKDGTTFSGNSDLTLTSDQEAKIGDEIIVEGVITLDKDFGSGYFFDVIMEGANLKSK